MQIAPSNGCRILTCLIDGCADAYQYPWDDSKMHTCLVNTDVDIIFCPGRTINNASTV